MNLQKIKENFKSLFCGGIFDSDHLTKKDYPEKTLRQLGAGTQFIIVGFTKIDNNKKGHPVCQLIHDFQNNQTHHDHLDDKTFFTLNKKIVGDLEWQKTYQVVTVKKTMEPETLALEQINMLIMGDVVMG